MPKIPVYKIFRTRTPQGNDVIVGMSRDGRLLASYPAPRAPCFTHYGKVSPQEREAFLKRYRRS